MDPHAQDEVEYRIDAGGILTGVGGAWDRFAGENGAPELVGAQVVGRRLVDLIGEPTTRWIYKQLIECALRGRPVEVPFRCDAPGIRRDMRMRIEADGQGGVVFRSRLEGAERRPRWPFGESGGGGRMVVVCSWCKRFQDGERWLEVEDAVATAEMFAESVPPAMTHGICPGCRTRLVEVGELAQSFAE